MVERPVPRPQNGEVLIKILAAGVNFADAMQTRGTYAHGPKPPHIAGFEACGEIVASGGGDVSWPIGAKVIVFGSGTFAEFMTDDARRLLPLPEGWSPAQEPP